MKWFLFRCCFFADQISSSQGQDYNYMGQFLKMLVSLGGLLGFIILSLWFLKKFMKSKSSHMNKNTAIRVLEKRVLHPKASIYLLDILGKGIVISESPAGIHRVAEFSADENVSLVYEQMQGEKKGDSFAMTLKQLLPFSNKKSET